MGHRKILTTFLEQNPWTEARSKDETTRKEVQIVGSASGIAQTSAKQNPQIQTLSRRAAQIYEASFAPGELTEHERDSVNLLLSLQGGESIDAAETDRIAAASRAAEQAKNLRKTTDELAATQGLGGRRPGVNGGQALGPGQQGTQQSPADKEDDRSQRLSALFSCFRAS